MNTLSAEPAEYLTVAETATRLRCGRRVIYDLIAAGQLRAVRIDTGPRARLRVPAEALQELARLSKFPASAPRTGPVPAVGAQAHGGGMEAA